MEGKTKKQCAIIGTRDYHYWTFPKLNYLKCHENRKLVYDTIAKLNSITIKCSIFLSFMEKIFVRVSYSVLTMSHLSIAIFSDMTRFNLLKQVSQTRGPRRGPQTSGKMKIRLFFNFSLINWKFKAQCLSLFHAAREIFFRVSCGIRVNSSLRPLF